MIDRRTRSRELREQTAQRAFDRTHFPQLPSGEEGAYVYNGELSYAGSFTKGLPHDDQTGLASPAAFRDLVHAITTTRDDDFSLVPFGARNPITGESDPVNQRPWVNPTAGASFDMEGPDAGALSIPPAPALTSAEVAAEMAELYWMALLRDLKFSDIEAGGPTVVTAVDSLNEFDWFQGNAGTPIGADRKRPPVTPESLFRGVNAGDEAGPYVSQFLVMGTNTLPNRGQPPVLADFQDGRIAYGAITIDQRVRPAKAGVDYMTSFDDWRKIQDGEKPATTDQFETTPRFITTPRDLATYVHFDALYEAYLNACLILLEIGAAPNSGLPFEPGASRQEGFGTFGGAHALSLVTEVATRALKCIWRQKWMVHRRARPEAVGGLLECHRMKPGGPQSPVPFIEPLADLLEDAGVLPAVLAAKGSHLLPMAFPEGSPMHPSYGAGHATVAGACVTILKALFDETHPLPFAFRANPADNGATLEDVTGSLSEALTVGGELNKLCSNISIGRDMAGVHYFTDYIESIRLGEQVACGILEEQAVCYPEDFSVTFTSFDRASDGSPIDITIEKTGDEVVKRQQVRPMTVAAGRRVLPIAAE